MYSYLYIAFITLFVLLIIYLSVNKNKETKTNIIYTEKAFLQSPEYCCSTKCFDCVKEQTFQHLNPSHGNPKMNVGL